MPLENEVPIELDKIKRKIVFGLTPRKLACLSISLVVTVVIAYLSIKKGWSTQASGWLIMVLAGLPFALGVLEPGGVPAEQYLLRKARHWLIPSRLCYRAEPVWLKNTEKGGKRKHDKTPMEARNTVWFDPNVGRKRRRKAAVRRAKEAESEYKAAAKAAVRSGAAQRP